jgi:hypothetical protein
LGAVNGEAEQIRSTWLPATMYLGKISAASMRYRQVQAQYILETTERRPQRRCEGAQRDQRRRRGCPGQLRTYGCHQQGTRTRQRVREEMAGLFGFAESARGTGGQTRRPKGSDPILYGDFQGAVRRIPESP